MFGDSPKYSLEQGLARMSEWARAHGSRKSHVFEDIEVMKNFPAGWLEAPVAGGGRR